MTNPSPPHVITGKQATTIIKQNFPKGITEGTHDSSWVSQPIADCISGYCSCGEWYCSVSDWYRTPEETVAIFDNEHRMHLLANGVSPP